MTVSTLSSRAVFTGDGATTTFPYSFRADSADVLEVSIVETATNIRTILNTSQWSHTGTYGSGSGTVNYPLSGDPLASTHTLRIERKEPYTQTQEEGNFQGYNPEVLHDTLDKIVMQIQQIHNIAGDVETTLDGYLTTILGYANSASADAASASADAAAAEVSRIAAELARDLAEGYANIAATANGLRDLQNLTALQNNTTYSYSGPNPVIVGDIFRTMEEGFIYRVLDSAASDYDIENSNATPVKFEVMPGPFGYDVKAFGAVGDNVADDSVPINRALQKDHAVYFSKPSVAFKCANLEPLRGCTMRGFSGFVDNPGTQPTILAGNGTDPIFAIGLTNPERELNFESLSMENDGADCLTATTADNTPNISMRYCRVTALNGGNAIDLKLSFRAYFANNKISSSGTGGVAFNAMDNVNGLTLLNNTITGGSAGTAVQIGQSQGLTIVNNIIESSLYGMYIASTTHVDDGNCNAVTIEGNYIEQCSTPLVLGTQFSILGASIKNNIVSNAGTSNISARTAILTIGRLRQAEISNNSWSVESGGSEDLIRLQMDHPTPNIAFKYFDNRLANTPANNIVKQGTLASSGTVNAFIGQESYIDLDGDKPPHKQEWISQKITGTETILNLPFWRRDDHEFGGRIDSAQIIDAQGTIDAAQIRVGDGSGSQTNVTAVLMSALTFTHGIADLTLASDTLDATVGEHNDIRVDGDAAATGTFRVKIRWRSH